MSATQTEVDAQREKQIRDAEELLFSGNEKLGLAKGLFLGRFVADWVMPYPTIPREHRLEIESSLKYLRAFLDEVVEVYEYVAEEKRIVIRKDYSEPCLALVDP